VWRQHWDFQLYKALEHQFRRGLELFNKSLPEVRGGGGGAATAVHSLPQPAARQQAPAPHRAARRHMLRAQPAPPPPPRRPRPPQLEVSIVFRQQRLQYDPPLEELRARHYRDLLGGFLGLPQRMRGVSDLSERPGFFRAIADCCPAGVARLYSSAEALFARLQEELKAYQVRRRRR
jgi:hypothetical protein